MSDFLTDIKTLRKRARDHPTTRGMLEGILAMEEEHADDLVNLLKKLGS
jgi:bacterioferritin (cytochrome b1)